MSDHLTDLFEKIERYLSDQTTVYTGLPLEVLNPINETDQLQISARLNQLHHEKELVFSIDELLPQKQQVIKPVSQFENENSETPDTEINLLSPEVDELTFEEEVETEIEEEINSEVELTSSLFEDIPQKEQVTPEEHKETPSINSFDLDEVETDEYEQESIDSSLIADEHLSYEESNSQLDSIEVQSDSEITNSEITETEESIEQEEIIQYDLFGSPIVKPVSKVTKNSTETERTPSLFDVVQTEQPKNSSKNTNREEKEITPNNVTETPFSDETLKQQISDSTPTTEVNPAQEKMEIELANIESTNDSEKTETTPLLSVTNTIPSQILLNESEVNTLYSETSKFIAPNQLQLELNECLTLDDLRLLCEKHKDLLRTDLEDTNLVFGVGNPNAKLLIVGEAPGENEDKQGEPFVGKAGQLLDKILEAIQFSRKDIYIANILKHRPPKNRDPLPEERERSLPFLLRQIEIIQPKLVLCLGRISARTLLGLPDTVSLAQLRGKFHPFMNNTIELTATYHPASLLRNPNWKRPTWEDVQMIRNRYDELS
jgi:uracil-DNA glycosylase